MFRSLRWPTALLLFCLVAPGALADDDPNVAASLRKRRAVLIQERTRLQGRIGLGRTPVAELEALAKRQKQDYLSARDDCRRAQQAAIDVHRAAVMRDLVLEEKRRSLKRLKERVDTRSAMIQRNNELIAANEVKIEADKKRLLNPPSFGTQETWDQFKSSHQAFDELCKATDALRSQNQVATRVIKAIEPAIKGTLTGAASVMAWQATLNDAALQEKNTWENQLAKWQRDNEWARRVALELTLGMDPAINESMNPELILAELSPAFQEKLMRERAEMYDQMADGVDKALKSLLAQAAADRAALSQLQDQLFRTEQEIYRLTAQIILEELPAGVVDEVTLRQLLYLSDWASGFRLDTNVREAVVEQFRRRSRLFLGEAEKIVSGLTGHAVILTCTPSSSLKWDPAVAKFTVTVQAEDEYLGKAIARLNYLCRRLCAVKTSHPVIDDWTFPEDVKRDGPPAKGHWPFRSRHTLTLTAAGKYPVALVRTLTLSVDPPPERRCPPEARAMFNREIKMYGQVVVEIAPPEFPSEIGGAWNGSMVMNALNYPHEEGQGCAMLENLKGQALGATSTLAPSNFNAGSMDLVITPPKGQASDPARLRYQNNNGAFTASGPQGNGTMSLKGTFKLNGEVWNLGGTWHWAGGQGVSAGGTWSISNPNAK